MDDDTEPLLRAMPRRPLYQLSGLITRIDLLDYLRQKLG